MTRLAALLAIGTLCACTTLPPGHDPGIVEVGRTRAADGLEIAYSDRGRGETALVFVHGWSCNRHYWKEQLDELAGSWRVVALDLGGHGDSGFDRERWTITGLAGDVEAVVDELDLQRVILVGHSMGGPVSLEAARRLGGRVIGVVVVDTLHDVEFEIPQETMSSMRQAFEHDFEGTLYRMIEGMYGEDDQDQIDWIRENLVGVHPEVAIQLFLAFPDLDLPALLADAGVPVRAINAGNTHVEVNQKYGDFDAVSMEDVGHFLMLEKPQQFNAELRGVLREIERGGG